MKKLSHYDFVDAQEAREALLNCGWMPLTKIENAEHWVRDDRRCIICYEGTTVDAELLSINYVHFVRLDSGEILANGQGCQ